MGAGLNCITVTRALAKAMTIVADIARATLSLKPPSYAKILELDERARVVATPAVKAVTPAHMPPSTFSASFGTIIFYLLTFFGSHAVSSPCILRPGSSEAS
jgi:hypothetical protein